MLYIRKSQMEAFRQASLRRFENRLARKWKSQPAMETLFPNQEWHHVFLEICTRAMRHGITDEADVEAFFNYVFAFGRDFGESAATAWAKGPLRNSHLTGHEKMLAIQTEYLKLSSHVGS